MQQNIIQMMLLILQRPDMYVGTKNVEDIENFMQGWQAGRRIPKELQLIKDFHIWAIKRYNSKKTMSIGWSKFYLLLAKRASHKVLGINQKEIAYRLLAQDFVEFVATIDMKEWQEKPSKPVIRNFRSIDEE